MKIMRFLIGASVSALAGWGVRELWIKMSKQSSSRMAPRQSLGGAKRKRSKSAKSAKASAAHNHVRDGLKSHG
jgi:hypothetical protein